MVVCWKRHGYSEVLEGKQLIWVFASFVTISCLFSALIEKVLEPLGSTAEVARVIRRQSVSTTRNWTRKINLPNGDSKGQLA